MNNELIEKYLKSDHAGCLGNFDMVDQICKKYCALKLRCAIESDQNDQLEILDELVAREMANLKMQ